MTAALTPNETEVLALLRGSNGPMTAYQLIGRMQRKGGAVAPPTVYRALKGLEDAGLVQRIETLRAWDTHTAPAPGVVAISDDCRSVRSVEAPGLLDNLHQHLTAEGFAEARQTIEVNGCCGDCSGQAMRRDLLLSGAALRLALALDLSAALWFGLWLAVG